MAHLAGPSAEKANGRQDLRLLCLNFAIAIVSALGTILVQTTTTLPDLTEKVVRPSVSSVAWPLLDWPTLLQNSSPLGIEHPLPGAPIRMLGYRMDRDRPIPEGRRVKEFLLMPEAGRLLHPAHRLSKEMVCVQVARRKAYEFQARALIWVQGRLSPKAKTAPSDTPAHTLFEPSCKGRTGRMSTAI